MGSSPKPGADRLSVPPEAVGAFSAVAASVLRRLTGPSLSGLALALAACGGDAPFGLVRRRFSQNSTWLIPPIRYNHLDEFATLFLSGAERIGRICEIPRLEFVSHKLLSARPKPLVEVHFHFKCPALTQPWRVVGF